MPSKSKKSIADILKTSKNIAYYGRISTKKQNSDHTHQDEKVERFLKEHGIKINGTKKFQDMRSAYLKPYNSKRRSNEEKSTNALEALLQEAANKKIDAVIIPDRDRISRQIEEHAELRDFFNKLDIPVIIASRGELYTNDDVIRNIVEDSITKMESDTISSRTKSTMQSLIKSKHFLGGPIPYGLEATWVQEPKSKNAYISGLVENAKEMVNVREIFDGYALGKTFSELSKALKQKDPDSKWSANKVKSIVLNPIYAGKSAYNRTIGKGGYTYRPSEEWQWGKEDWFDAPPIPWETWRHCLKRFESEKTSRPRETSSFFLKGIIKCHCKKPMASKDKRTNINKPGKDYGTRVYFCEDCKPKVQINAEMVHSLFMNELSSLGHPSELIINSIGQKLNGYLLGMKEKSEILEARYSEEKNNLARIDKELQSQMKKSVVLKESEDFKVIALHIAKKDVEEQIDEIECSLKKCTEIIERLSQSDITEKKVKEHLLDNNWIKKLSNSQLHKLAGLLVLECSVNQNHKINIELKR